MTSHNTCIADQSAPVGPESLLPLAVCHVYDLADAGDDVRAADDELTHVSNLVAFRQSEDVLDAGCRRYFLVEPHQQRLKRQERLVADRRSQTLDAQSHTQSISDTVTGTDVTPGYRFANRSANNSLEFL